MTPLDFYLWRHLKSLVYEASIQSQQDLIGRIIEASARISEIFGDFDRIQQSMHLRLNAYIAEQRGTAFRATCVNT